MRQGLALLINREPDLMVCGEAEEAHSAMQAIAALRPDIVIVDISLDGPDGLELLKQVRARDADLPILILSMHDESIYAERALRAGASGYIMKQEATERVLTAIRRILAGEVYVSDRVASTDAAAVRRADRRRGSARRSTSLSDRELEVFRLIGDGSSTRQIADESALERQDRRVLPGAHQGKAGAAQRARAPAPRHRVGAQRESRIAPIRDSLIPSAEFPRAQNEVAPAERAVGPRS